MRFSAFGRLLLLAGTVLCLSGCAETQLISHYAKKLPWPGYEEPSGNGGSQGGYKVGKAYKVDGRWYQPRESFTLVETGIASWYGPGFHAKRTANGEVFDQNTMTAAHRTLQMPSLVRVTNLENGRSAILRVNDRGPFKSNRVLDVSSRGAEVLGFRNKGTARVRIEVLAEESKVLASAAREGRDTSRMSYDSIRASLDKAGDAPVYVAQGSSSAPVVITGAPVMSSPSTHRAAGPYGTYAAANKGWSIQQQVSTRKTSSDLPESLQPTTVTAGELREDIALQEALHRPATTEGGDQPAIGGTASVKPVEAEATMPPVSSYPIIERAPSMPLPKGSGPAPVVSSGTQKAAVSSPSVTPSSLPAVAPAAGGGQGHVFIQAGSFSVYENASRLVDRLQPLAPGRIDPVPMKGKEFYRVRLGPFDTTDRARSMLQRVIDAGNPTARVVVD